MEFLPMAGIAIKNLFSRPATRLYPKVVRPPFAGNRGHIEIDFSACILCGMCARRCPAHAIAVDRAKGEWKIDRLSCVICAGCVAVCPKKCLSLHPERAAVTASLKKVEGAELHVRAPQPAAPASPADSGASRGA
jgi:formate hydrogenlyase subunit 6/NADH:ubiquinone oxidoreductase subunit I